MTRIKRAALLLGILTVFFVSTLGVAQSGVSPLGIVPTPIPGGLTVSIATDKTSYMIGESVTITYTVSQAAYIYLLDFQPDGIVRQVFPNQYSMANYVAAGTHMLPDGMYRFTVSPPTGLEQLQIIASPTPLNFVAYNEPFPMVGPNPNAAAMSIQVQIKGIVPEPQWATAWTSFTIVPAYTYTPPSGYYYFYPPFPGFPGGTWYWQSGQWNYGIPAEGIYWYFGTDGKWHLRIAFHFNFGG